MRAAASAPHGISGFLLPVLQTFLHCYNSLSEGSKNPSLSFKRLTVEDNGNEESYEI